MIQKNKKTGFGNYDTSHKSLSEEWINGRSRNHDVKTSRRQRWPRKNNLQKKRRKKVNTTAYPKQPMGRGRLCKSNSFAEFSSDD